MDQASYFDGVFKSPDPWNYASHPYELAKYEQTLASLPICRIDRAIEYGCAEGYFTQKLATRVEALVACDVSGEALKRAEVNCEKHSNIQFVAHNLETGAYGTNYDLILCAEILYYLRDYYAIESVAHSLVGSLNPGGVLVLVHANQVSDSRDEPGFDWAQIGAKGIGQIFARQRSLEFSKEYHCPLYRIQLFTKTSKSADGLNQLAICSDTAGYELPKEKLSIKLGLPLPCPARMNGCVITDAESRQLWMTPKPRILMYHRVADDGPNQLAPYRLSLQSFERQLMWLQRHGFTSLTLSEYSRRNLLEKKTTLAGRKVILTFDDAYLDFYTSALPLLKQYGFNATVFVPTQFIGGAATWDSQYGVPAPIMQWNHLADIVKEGIDIGSHGCCHVAPQNMASSEEYLGDLIQSRDTLEDKLGIKVTTYCYPYAYAPPDLRPLIHEAGYECAVGGDVASEEVCNAYLRREEVLGDMDIPEYARMLEPSCRHAGRARQENYARMLAVRSRRLYFSF